MFTLRMSSFPLEILRGTRGLGGFCAIAVMPNAMAIAEAMARREILQSLE
jgi:hypothetical protein